MSHRKTYNIRGINCIWLPRLVQLGFFLPCTGQLQLFRGHCAEEQPSAAGTLFRGGYICKDFLFSKYICEDTAHCHVITPDFFIGQCKVILDGKFFPCDAGRPRFPVRCGGRSYMTESDLAFPIISRFSYSSTMETRFFFTYQLS